MPLPDIDALTTFGGALNDYAPVIDSTTDRPAAGANPAYGNVAMMTHTAWRFFARFTPAGTGTPVLAASGTQWDALWAAATGTAPTPARTGVGVYTLTWPSTVQDEVPAGAPGSLNGTSTHTLNLRAAEARCEGSTLWFVQAQVTSPNVVTIWTFNTSFALADPNGPTFVVFGL